MTNLNHISLNKKLVMYTRVDKNISKSISKLIKGIGKKMQQKIKFILLVISIILISTLNANLLGQGKDELHYVTLPGSKLWIDGTSNIDSFTCKSHLVKGYAEIGQGLRVNSPSSDDDTVIVSVLVHSLDCGQGLMNADMYNAMKADKYPMIKYELLDAHLSSYPDSLSGWFTLDTKGNLYIAGEKNIVNIKMQVEKLPNGNYRLVGSKPLSMLNYGIIPPSHFFGLIHAHDKLVVHFDLLATRESKIKSITNEDVLLAK